MPYIKNSNKDKLHIYYEDLGNKDSNTVVLIHPIGGNVDIWKDEISLISQMNIRVIAYELRGHNRSNMGTKNYFTIHHLVQDLKLLINSLEIKKCTLVGHSIGGSIASLYAVKYPKNIEGMILINGSSFRIPDIDLQKHVTTRKIALLKGMGAVAQWIKHESSEGRKAFEDEKNWKEFEQIFMKTSVEGFVAATKSLYTMPDHVTDSLKNTNYKIFGIVGEADDVFMRLMHKMKGELPRFELRILKDSDHWVIVDHPEELFKALKEFLHKIYPCL